MSILLTGANVFRYMPGEPNISFERQIHGFITMSRVLDEANVAVRICAMELKTALV